MQSTSTPTKMPVPFAESGTKNAVPIPSQIGVTPGLASFTTGFPPLTFTPIAAGGVPPFGADFNGVLNAITQALRWSNAGGQYIYDSDFATAIGGYPKGALLQRSTLDGLWMSTADNNTTDPDSGGVGWVDPLAGRLLSIQTFDTAGTFTYTPAAGTAKIIVDVQAGGGAGGGTGATDSTHVNAAGGGGAGAFARALISSSFSGVSITVGAGGIGVPVGIGGNGGSSSFGALVSCPGGTGAPSQTQQSSPGVAVYGSNTSAPAGGNLLNLVGNRGEHGLIVGISPSGIYGGSGASSFFGPALGQSVASGSAGNPGSNFGSGGSGACSGQSTSAKAGGNGAPGIVIVYEYS